jgi:hypothetical protein
VFKNYAQLGCGKDALFFFEKVRLGSCQASRVDPSDINLKLKLSKMYQESGDISASYELLSNCLGMPLTKQEELRVMVSLSRVNVDNPVTLRLRLLRECFRIF